MNKTLRQRFWLKVDKSGDCWLWTGARDDKGYGKFRISSNPDHFTQAHRFAYSLKSPLSPTETLDHLCGEESCVRRGHLEKVSRRVNTLREWKERRNEKRNSI